MSELIEKVRFLLDTTIITRQRLLFLSVHILCGLLRRITIPTNPAVCATGGYQETFEEIVFVRNPASPAFMQLVPSLVKLLTFCHALHSPSSPLVQSSFSFLSTMTDAEKAVYLQQQDTNEEPNLFSSVRSNPLGLSANDRRLHNRFSSFLDRLQILVGTYFTLKPDLYRMANALNVIGTTLFSSLDHLPDFRLRNLVRNCFLPFVRHCPQSSMLVAILESLLPFIYTKLKEKWKVITDRQAIQLTNGQSQSASDDDHQTQDRCEEEVIEEQVSRCSRDTCRRSPLSSFQVTCYLTRDFLEMIKSFLTHQVNATHLANGPELDESSMDGMITADEPRVTELSSTKSVNHTRLQPLPSEFALKILQESPVIARYSLLLLFDGLSWPDTSSVTKMSQICQALIKHLSTLIPGNLELLRQIYIYILCALKTHGDNEPIVCALLSLAILLYETFQQTSSNLFDSVLMEIPDVTNEQVNTYRDKMHRQLTGKALNDKQKRDMLKQLVQPLMGHNVAQMFRREPLALNDLPPLIRFSKRSLHPVLQQQSRGNRQEDDDHGLASLFHHAND